MKEIKTDAECKAACARIDELVGFESDSLDAAWALIIAAGENPTSKRTLELEELVSAVENYSMEQWLATGRRYEGG